jgi:hypothetical protein
VLTAGCHHFDCPTVDDGDASQLPQILRTGSRRSAQPLERGAVRFRAPEELLCSRPGVSSELRERRNDMQHAQSDRLPRALLVLALGVPLVHVLLRATPLGPNFLYVMLVMPALALVWFGAAVWATVLAVRYARRKIWRSFAITTLLPLIVVSAAVTFPRFLHACNYAGDVLHFAVARPYYDRAVASLPALQKPRLAVFNWGGMIWASGGLVFDESDEVALPAGQQSATWRAKAINTELSCDGYGVQPLWSHYYLASFPC